MAGRGLVGTIGSLAMAMLMGAGLAGCQNPDSGGSVQTVTVPKEFYWRSNAIPVCWENGGEATASLRSRTRDFVQGEFSRTTLSLTGWGRCDAESRGIRIFIYDDPEIQDSPSLLEMKEAVRDTASGLRPGHPRVRAWGNKLDGMVAGVILTHSFEEVEPYLTTIMSKLSPDVAHNLVDSIVLHEFGHAVGLRHEDSHPDRTCNAFEEDIAGGIPITGYNFESVMNRCFYRDFDYAKGKLRFTRGDIEGIRVAYPPAD